MSDTEDVTAVILCCPVCATPEDVLVKGKAEHKNFTCSNCLTIWTCTVNVERVEEFGHG